jgi:hypothetical protein
MQRKTFLSSARGLIIAPDHEPPLEYNPSSASSWIHDTQASNPLLIGQID